MEELRILIELVDKYPWTTILVVFCICKLINRIADWMVEIIKVWR